MTIFGPHFLSYHVWHKIQRPISLLFSEKVWLVIQIRGSRLQTLRSIKATPMKRILTAIFTAVFLLFPIASFSGYVIHLKDGTQFVTDQYFEEGGQIKFTRYGGLIGIEKDRISKIEETEPPAEPPEKKKMPAEEKASPAAEETSKKEEPEKGTAKLEDPEREVAERAKKDQRKDQLETGQLTEEQKKEAEKTKREKIAAFLEEKRLLNNEMKRVYLEFKKAQDERNKKARKEHLVEFGLLRQKFDELEERVRATYGGKLPDWWNEAR
jgi:hypothetical protein